MTTNMITAARLLAHKTVNGKYQTLLALDKFPVLGHQMSHSIDTFITDSANSASALYSGHKSTVNAMGVYADSSPNFFDDPKVETIVELLHRIWVRHLTHFYLMKRASTKTFKGVRLGGCQYRIHS